MQQVGELKPDSLVKLEQEFERQLWVGSKDTNSAAAMARLREDDAAESLAHKLAVERAALLRRLKQLQKQRETVEAVQKQLSDSLSTKLDNALLELNLEESGIPLCQTQLDLLLMLADDDADIHRLRPLILSLPWLARDLAGLMRSDQLNSRTEVDVKNPKLVVNYLGIERLRLWVPYFCARHWLPVAQARLIWPMRKLWRYQLVRAIAARQLGELSKQGLKPYVLSWLMGLPRLACLWSGGRLSDQLWGEFAMAAARERDRVLYESVQVAQIEMSGLQAAFERHQGAIWTQLWDNFKLEEHTLIEAIRFDCGAEALSELSPLSRCLLQSDGFAKSKLLGQWGSLAPAVSRQWHQYWQFNHQAMERLARANFHAIDGASIRS
ncbi:hypothetical protein [Paraferrimonas sedimenticola]|uniref:Histidine kinase n=1 Tax=Paraferrimonas sedimenticola TaxID=375674 RepID=A0AA37RU39_9GAMM|nr:hypothetical protein [Paraferrimonas sedimenticola]GLP95795.1 histidine kinase [Paraferrimonas sedimenticola]